MNELQLDLFSQPDPTRGRVRATDLEPAHQAAEDTMPTNEANRRIVLRLLVEHRWLTQFCPYVLMNHDHRFKQTAIGPRFANLCRTGLIELIEKRPPRNGAETHRLVSTYRVTDKGREYLARCAAETTT